MLKLTNHDRKTKFETINNYFTLKIYINEK